MSFLKALMGSSKSAEKVLDAGIAGLDKLVFTAEEKADYQRELQAVYLKFVELSANETTAQSVSRRLICLPVVYTWLIMIIVNAVVSVFAPDVNLVPMLDTIAFMNVPALASIGFYVGRHLVADFASKK